MTSKNLKSDQYFDFPDSLNEKKKRSNKKSKSLSNLHKKSSEDLSFKINCMGYNRVTHSLKSLKQDHQHDLKHSVNIFSQPFLIMILISKNSFLD